MKRTDDRPLAIPLHDYGRALQSAVTWLGDRYLLASPMPRRADEAFFRDTHGWHRAAPPQSGRNDR